MIKSKKTDISLYRLYIIFIILLSGMIMFYIELSNPTPIEFNFKCDNGTIETYNLTYLEQNPDIIICYDPNKPINPNNEFIINLSINS